MCQNNVLLLVLWSAMVRSNLTDRSIAIGVYQDDEAEVYFINDIRNETETTTFRQQTDDNNNLHSQKHFTVVFCSCFTGSRVLFTVNNEKHRRSSYTLCFKNCTLLFFEQLREN